jgi:hypothetical protein
VSQGGYGLGSPGTRVFAEGPHVLVGVETALDQIEAEYSGRPLVVVSCLAEGADRLVAEATLRRVGARLVAVLPMRQRDLMADFGAPESRVEFLTLLSQAREIVQMPARATRDEAYVAANNWLLDNVDVLVAVWDGLAAEGPGGTAEVVAQARARAMPLAWVHATKGKRGAMETTSLGAEQGRTTFENPSTARSGEGDPGIGRIGGFRAHVHGWPQPDEPIWGGSR